MTRVSRRRFAAVLLTGGLAVGSGCLSSGSSRADDLERWPPPGIDDELSFWTWHRYWGSQAIAFQHTTDLDDIDRESVPPPAQLQRLEAGESPDVIHLPGRQFRRALEAGLLQRLPTDVMPSWPPDERLRDHDLSYYGTDDGFYGIPQTPLVFSLAIHHDRVPRTASWETLWDEVYAGRIDMPADPVLAAKVAALYLGQDPDDPGDLGAIERALVAQHPLVGSYWRDWYQCWRRFASGETLAAVLPHPRLCLCAQDGTPIVYDVPERGVLSSQSVLAIPDGAENPHAAVAFVDWGADLKSGTETGWNADEWTLYFDRPVDRQTRSVYGEIATDLGFA